MTHILLRGAQASQDEGLDQKQRRLTMRRILRQTLPLQRRMNQVHRTQRVLLDDQSTFHGLVEDPNEELTDEPRMIMQMRGTLARHLTT